MNKLVIVQPHNNINMRLANIMFLYGVSLSLCKKYNKEFFGLVKPNDFMFCYDLHNKFNLFNNIPFNQYITIDTDLSKYITIPNDDSDIVLTGYCQNINMLDKQLCLDLFGISKKMYNDIYNLYGDISNYVCCHVRRGDYLNLGNRDKHKIFDIETINNIINIYFPNDKILFVSDDINWCKQNFIGDKYKFADKSVSEYMDLYIMTLCKSNIISNSTFALFGAYLNQNINKKVINILTISKNKYYF